MRRQTVPASTNRCTRLPEKPQREFTATWSVRKGLLEEMMQVEPWGPIGAQQVGLWVKPSAFALLTETQMWVHRRGAKEGETWEKASNVLIMHQCVALPEEEWLD